MLFLNEIFDIGLAQKDPPADFGMLDAFGFHQLENRGPANRQVILEFSYG